MEIHFRNSLILIDSQLRNCYCECNSKYLFKLTLCTQKCWREKFLPKYEIWPNFAAYQKTEIHVLMIDTAFSIELYFV